MPNFIYVGTYVWEAKNLILFPTSTVDSKSFHIKVFPALQLQFLDRSIFYEYSPYVPKVFK